MLYSMWPLAFISILVQLVHALDLFEPVAVPPFTRPSFGHPFTVSWTLDGSEVGDRLVLRVRAADSSDSGWIILANNVRLSDRKVTAQLDRAPSTLPSVAYYMEATDPTNELNTYSSIAIAIYSDSMVTTTRAESTPTRTTPANTVNAGPTSQNPQSSQNVTPSADEGTTGTSSSPSPQSAPPSNGTTGFSNTSPSATPSLPTAFSPDAPSDSAKPQAIVKHPPPIGAIVGGVVGGLTVVALVLVYMLLLSRRQRPDLNAIPMPHDETRVAPATKRERLELEMTEAQRQRERLQSDLEGMRHRSVHGPIATGGAAVRGDGFNNDAQRLRFEVGMMSERILELEDALQELGADEGVPTHPPPDYASVADQER